MPRPFRERIKRGNGCKKGIGEMGWGDKNIFNKTVSFGGIKKTGRQSRGDELGLGGLGGGTVSPYYAV